MSYNREQRKRYNEEYNREGFKKIANRRYYMKHRVEILKKAAQKRRG